MIRFGISRMPPEGVDLAGWLDSLVARGHDAVELPFVTGFPWKEKQCAQFGKLAAERGVAVSVHAPYFAVLTVDNPEKRKKTLSPKKLSSMEMAIQAKLARASKPQPQVRQFRSFCNKVRR